MPTRNGFGADPAAAFSRERVHVEDIAPVNAPNGHGEARHGAEVTYGARKPNGSDYHSSPQTPSWPAMEADAYHGLAGDIVRSIEPHSEADPVALLVQTLASAGSAI